MTDQRRVLIMEDNRALALEWKEAFELNQCDVVLCHTGEEAANYLEQETFDLVITDIFVDGEGERGGLYVLGQLIKMGKDAPPSIAVTGAFAHLDTQMGKNLFLSQASRLGASMKISKPFPPMELVLLAFNFWDNPENFE